MLLVNLAARLRSSRDRAQRAERRLIEAIETIPDGFVLFDSEDRLVTCNAAYREVYSTTADKIRPGVRFEQLLRLGLERGQHRVPEGEREDWLKTRLANHKTPSGSQEQMIDSGRWLRFVERRTADGGVVGIRTDITELSPCGIVPGRSVF